MKLFGLIWFVLLLNQHSIAQSCLPNGIGFYQQYQIDEFAANYPNCTEIEGDVFIQGNDITNLNGLSVLTSIGGSLYIGEFNTWQPVNPGLTSFTGLNNLTSIGNSLNIRLNANLETLNGLNGLQDIDSILYISENPRLNNLSALANLTSVGKKIIIEVNDSLSDITGIGNIDCSGISELSINFNPLLNTCNIQSLCNYLSNPAGTVTIFNNSPGCDSPPEIASACGFTMDCLPYGHYYFTDQSDIDSFQVDYPDCSVLNGMVRVSGNNITDLYGLQVIDSIFGFLWFEYNDSLSALHGLESLKYISNKLEFWGNPSLLSLEGLDSLTAIGGNLSIKGYNSLVSLTGLESLSFIGGNLEVWQHDDLTSFNGLNSLAEIGGSLDIAFLPSIKSLSGLDNLAAVGGSVGIGLIDSLESLEGLNNLATIGYHLSIVNNWSLTDLNALSNLQSIGGDLNIRLNPNLRNLTGLDNIDPGSIMDLQIKSNSKLSVCAIQSICDYLASPNGTVQIEDNSPGCNSQQEVDSACVYLIDTENGFEKDISIFPNPSNYSIAVEMTRPFNTDILLTIFRIDGQKLIEQNITRQRTVVDISTLPPGVYLVRLVNNKSVMVQRILVN